MASLSEVERWITLSGITHIVAIEQFGWTTTLCNNLVSGDSDKKKPKKMRLCSKCRNAIQTAIPHPLKKGKHLMKTEIWLEVYGDWWTVISANDYREMLLAQKPHDVDDADYYAYRIRCKDSKELFKAIKVFHEEKKLECHIVIHSASELKTITAITGSGWGHDDAVIVENYRCDNPQEIMEQRDELRSALCVARENGRNQLGLTLRKFAALCGRSPSWISRWTNSDIDGPPDLVD